jgi:heme o synthase
MRECGTSAHSSNTREGDILAWGGFRAGKSGVGHLRKLLKIGRWNLCLATALAATSGALLTRPIPDRHTAAVFAGAFLFAMACTWLNQIQERKRDALMHRTRNRLLARGLLSVRAACLWALLCLAASLPILVGRGGWPALGILALTMLSYNGLYTLLKDRSLLALFPGAAAGAAPPVLGWVCGGGAMYQPVPLMLFLLFFLWQIPHFWLAAERSSPDYRAAGIPVPWRIFGSQRYARMLALWVGAFCVMLLGLLAFGFVHSIAAQWVFVGSATALLAGLYFPTLRRFLFHNLNLSMAAACFVLVAERLYRG